MYNYLEVVKKQPDSKGTERRAPQISECKGVEGQAGTNSGAATSSRLRHLYSDTFTGVRVSCIMFSCMSLTVSARVCVVCLAGVDSCSVVGSQHIWQCALAWSREGISCTAIMRGMGGRKGGGGLDKIKSKRGRWQRAQSKERELGLSW